MKQFYLKKVLVYFLFLFAFSLHAQTKSASQQATNTLQEQYLNEVNQRFFDEHGYVPCVTDEAHEMRMQNDSSVQSMDSFENWLAPLVEAKKARMIQDINNGSTSRVSYTIPIIFHVITGSVGDAYDLDSQYINAQIEQLNIDFNNMAGSLQPAAHSADITFVPAQVDPDGNPLAEPGINRVYGYSGPYTMTTFNNNVKPYTVWDRGLYANIWVTRLQPGLLGYAQFPSNSTLPGMPTNGGSASTDGVVVTTVSVGSVANPNPYGGASGLGRTLTHEIGHWVGLRHIWGDTESCGGPGDFCADTPDSDGPNGGCTPTDSCPADGLGPDMIENYMDYTNDACMNTFTFDQVARMITVIENADGFDTLINSPTGNAGPVIAFESSTLEESEGTSCDFRDIDFPVSIGLAPSADATVTFVASGTATDMVDYEILTPYVTFAAGSNASQSLTLRVYEDALVEDDETVIVNMTLSTTGDAELTTNGFETLTFTIKNDDVAPEAGSLVTLFEDDFESYTNFDIEAIGGWTMIDGDGDSTYGADGYIFPNQQYTGTFIVFNPSATSPSAAGGAWDPHSGSKGYYCFNSSGDVSGQALNDDMIFTPQITLDGTNSMIKYWAKGLTNNYAGGERYRVGVSTSNDGTGITYLTDFPYVQPTLEWAEYSYSIPSSFDGQDVYVVFHVVSADEFVFMLDDVSVTTNATAEVQTAVSTASPSSMNLKEAGTSYAYDAATNNVVVKLENNNAFDYGCVNVSVMRAGTAAQVYENATSSNYVADKAFNITTANQTTSGDVTLGFYFTEAEIAGWEAATGRNRSEIVVIREVDGNVVESVATTVGAYDSNVILEAAFSGANGDFYFGPPEALSITENTFENFALYPNPAKGEITVQLNSNEDVKVTLYDIRGREVYMNTFSNNQATFNKTISLESFSTGLYLIKFESGAKKTTKKIVKM
ncbi:zinc-dependent metalloprotease [Oceanihabitans sediminis]|uniref:zinc-dependent metalloprotease n=1 Tax=Oceanihabitans sediminis TaxID=1812012 RepID=UPI00092FFD52|nr:zinc-dependent metalloprotease [Oceanihabitans sediminis]MDX1277679.1 T9SS type A sorting domain-containing protein [Oceanihabitans sediminis]